MAKQKKPFESPLGNESVVPSSETTEAQVNVVPPKEEEKPTVKPSYSSIKYREVVYVGVADEAERIGAVTGNRYIFKKDSYRMPAPTSVDQRDYPMLISERGKGCARRDPAAMFISKMDWDLEIQQARSANQ